MTERKKRDSIADNKDFYPCDEDAKPTENFSSREMRHGLKAHWKKVWIDTTSEESAKAGEAAGRNAPCSRVKGEESGMPSGMQAGWNRGAMLRPCRRGARHFCFAPYNERQIGKKERECKDDQGNIKGRNDSGI